MKKRILTTALAASLALGMSAPALAHGSMKPSHDGVVQMSGEIMFEMVKTAKGIDIYITEEDEPLAASDFDAKLIVTSSAGAKATAALTPVSGNRLDWLSQSGYGFQGDWLIEGDEPTQEEIELQATKNLLFHGGENDAQHEKIERFCLPILRGGNDDSAIDLVFDNFDTRPQLTRLYASYLTHFSRESPDIAARISRLIQRDQFFCDYQRMYVLASILNREANDAGTVLKCQQWMESGTIGAETRALAAIFVAKFGSPQQKRSVRLRYENEPSEYVRAAILFSAQFFTLADQRTAKRAWGGHSSINAMIADAI